MYTYTEVIGDKIMHIHGKFIGWTEKVGAIDVRYAIFRNRVNDILIPEYLLPPETVERIGGRLP